MINKFEPVNHCESPHAPTLKELAEMRKRSPISKNAIVMQAGLYQSIREGKVWAQNQKSLKTMGGSVNKVFRLYAPNGNRETAYFKVGQSFEENQGKMEKLIWDAAIILGLEEQFVPTALTEVRSFCELSKGKQSASLWENDGDNLKPAFHQDLKEGLVGGIQMAQKGTLLANADESSIGRKEVMQGILTSVLFGMFDAHKNNIFVTKEGKIKFFDNSRSLPHSNCFITDDNGIVPTYRSALLDLPQASEALTDEELSLLKTQISDLKKRAAHLESFMISPQTKAMINQLPPGWLDKEAAMNALTLRLNSIENALAGGKISTPLDIALSAFPDYKLAFALNYVYFDLDNSLHSPHNDVGYNTMNTVVDSLQAQGIDIAQVQKWCEDLPFPELLEKLETADFTLITAPEEDIKQSYTDLKKYIVRRAPYDLKDISPARCRKALEDYNTKVLKKNGYIFHQQNGEWWILHNTDNGPEAKKIELKPFQEIVLDNDLEIPLQDFKKFI